MCGGWGGGVHLCDVCVDKSIVHGGERCVNLLRRQRLPPQQLLERRSHAGRQRVEQAARRKAARRRCHWQCGAGAGAVKPGVLRGDEQLPGKQQPVHNTTDT